MPNQAYMETRDQIAKRLMTDGEIGLTTSEARARLEQYGFNSLQEKKKQTIWSKLLNQFKDAMVLILIAAALISGFLAEWIDAAVILAIVVINAVLGLIQEGRAEKAIEALKKMTSPQARVIRDGELQIIEAAQLVPGDLIVLEAGDIVPADIRLFESSAMTADEASLTGESVPVRKDAAETYVDTMQLGDRHNMVFMSTPITSGRGRGVVIATGSQTIIGGIADRLQEIKEEETPLQRNLNQLGKWLGIVCIAVCAIVFLQGILMGGEFLTMFMTAVSLAVAAIPEGLPAVVTIVLALGMKRMADRNAIVKKLLAVETLGSVDVICSDKTGTLTQNEMMVTRLYVPERLIEVDGQGYTPEGNLIDSSDGQPLEAPDQGVIGFLLKIGGLCNDARLVERDGVYAIIGDPTEGALVVAAAKAGLGQNDLQKQYPRVEDLPFDSKRKMMSTCHTSFGEAPVVSLTKGAPDIILSRCSQWMSDDGPQPMTEELRQTIFDVNRQLASSALRVLAFACKYHDGDVENAEEDLIFVGLMGMIDPARPEARDAVTLCTRAGIRAVMITGDYLDTAVAIANDLGMIKSGDRVLTGAELDAMSDEDLIQAVETTAVYARVSPDHKVRIVNALRQNGHIASMTGDGVNDALALKSADIGVAMGITGTDVAKGTADMILTDDNFATIVAAVKEGRILYSNIRKFVGFLLSCNVGEILVIFLVSLLMGPAMVPLLPIQLLWLNLVTDSFPALALGQEKGEPDIMEQKPRHQKEPILNRLMIRTIIIQAVAIFISTFSAFRIGLAIYGHGADGGPSDGARTFAFVTLILAELFRSYSARSERLPVLKIGVFTNPTLNKAILLSLALLLVVIYVPILDPIFHTISLGLLDWVIIIPLAFVPFLAAEGDKFLRLVREKRQNA
ncbi:MAG: cation-translocating P-type ATPase [Saccharofermentanales bacterium]|jgi:Ca2+-transporting ATPase|nr:cation-translocating P-type ATPase [Clostridiaceae bacterium]